MEFFATLFGAFVLWKLFLALVVGVLFPLFWIWMIADAILRDTADFQSGSTNEKLIWILAIAFFHIAAVVYFFAVYRPARAQAVPARPVAVIA